MAVLAEGEAEDISHLCANTFSSSFLFLFSISVSLVGSLWFLFSRFLCYLPSFLKCSV